MNFSFYFKLYILTIPIFFLLDMVWLEFAKLGLHNNHLGQQMANQENWGIAIIFYLFYIIALILFAVVPALKNNDQQKAYLFGVTFGFFTYLVYDLINLLTLKDWSIKVIVVDILWGMLLCGVVASISFRIGRWLR